ncbi:MAG: polyprenyl synthetase family protein, partial [Clostridiales bacterium]|nr:polyprenyl synthetase family protein [Clostridiales bacterium]
GDAIALLTGDALIASAAELLATYPSAGTILNSAFGFKGVTGGQALELDGSDMPSDILTVYYYKTAKLFEAAVVSALINTNASIDDMKSACEYCYCIGIAFQISDDLADSESDDGSFVKAVGVDKAREIISAILSGARAAAAKLSKEVPFLKDFVDFLTVLQTER